MRTKDIKVNDGQNGRRNERNKRARKKNAGGSEIFRTPPDRLWGLYSLLSSGYRVSLQEEN